MPPAMVTCLFLISLSAIPIVGSVDDITILEQYISVCGMVLCNSSMFEIQPDLDYSPQSYCPECKCDTNCWLRRDCCPDLYLSFPAFSEVKTNVFPTMNESTTDSHFKMIATCPNENHDCEVGPALADVLNNVPVFAGPYHLPFRSACYATCHGYDVTTSWYLDTSCTSFYDLNYCSSFQEISTVLNNSNCNIQYGQDSVTDYKPTTDVIINTCNVTGFWDTYDADVDKLCARLGPEMGRHSLTHSNVFCYICNPSETVKSDVISTCNVTGKWNFLDQGLRKACEYYPLARSEQPYKNWFCRLCNQNNADPSTVDLLDGSITIDFDTVASWNHYPAQRYDVTVQSVDIENIVNIVKLQRMSDNSTETEFKSMIQEILENDGEIDFHGTTVNITHLLFKIYLRTGSYDICTPSLLNVTFTERSNNCSCNLNCIFSKTDVCCPDVKLLARTKCIDEFGLSATPSGLNTVNQWLVTDKCPADYDDDVISYLCQNDEVNSAYQLVPVESIASKMAFKNIFCAICHLNNDMADSYDVFVRKMDFYTIRLVCALPVPFQNELSISDIISRAKTESCTIQYVPANLMLTCDVAKVNRGQCNKVNAWTEGDPDVKWACENTDIFPPFENSENIFCDICNPSKTNPAFFKSCNMSRVWRHYNQDLEKACLSYPAIQKTSPFKNGLCQRCNSPEWSRTFRKKSVMLGTVNNLNDLNLLDYPRTTLRSFFTTYYEQPLNDEDVPVTCKHNQIYDVWKEKCRNLTCNPGRHLYNKTCVPLLKTTTNLSYSLSLGLHGQINITEVYITDLLEGISYDVHAHLERILNVKHDSITISSFHVMSNIGCPDRTSVLQSGSSLDILISTHFEIQNEYTDRFETEKTLVELPGKIMDVRYAKKLSPFRISKQQKAFILSALIKKTSLNHKCYTKQMLSSKFSPHRSYRRSQVGELLQCRQVLLDKHEYEVDEDGMTLTFAGSDVMVHYPDFESISNGQVRVCESRLPSVFPVKSVENTFENAYRIFTLVFVCLSLLCILISVIPYYKFAYLRTLSGLNNVGLMTSLFIVQLIFIIQTFTATGNDTVCAIFGILMHVLWLVYFAWTGVGTLHMYRVFVSDDYFIDDDKRYSSFRHYGTCTAIFAGIVVILNIGLTAAITGGATIGYGGNGCFMTSLPGKILSFIVPVILICGWDAVFFWVTVRHIRNTSMNCRSVIADKSIKKDNKFSLGLFLKLFIISGSSWILQVIDGFFPLSVFSFIVTLVNASQGILILYLSRKNFKKKKNRRRPGSRYTGSASRSHSTTLSSSTKPKRTSVNTVSEKLQNNGFDSIKDICISQQRRLSTSSNDLSTNSTEKIIREDNEKSYSGSETIQFNVLDGDRNDFECHANAMYQSEPIELGKDGKYPDHVGEKDDDSIDDRAECASIEDEGEISFTLPDQDQTEV
ncbi:uncharacterized protein LOC132552950 [Ylistrum balloti]|uniref:uncharacterized protein LOC132552950 n=1 Tax=Ylistrum balloti TaxID=509963 RepID=UPI002905A496|nr:uncharacterized protein LOC132552950 [Ylistrum balloti]